MSAPIEIELILPKSPQRVGARLEVGVVLRNASSAPVWIVGVMDGSEAGFRYPHYRATVATPAPRETPEGDGCGITAPLRLVDFLRLAPGEGCDPRVPVSGQAWLPITVFEGFVPSTAGRYTFELVLSTLSAKDEEWLGIVEYPGKDAVLARLKEVPRLEVRSNVAVLDVR
jgi:hypothetical protein